MCRKHILGAARATCNWEKFGDIHQHIGPFRGGSGNGVYIVCVNWQRAVGADEGRHAVIIVGSHGTFCTGAAIARDLVLTAGHCVEAGTHYKVVEFDAAHQPQLLDVREAVRHPQFDLKTLFAHRATADVALMKMAAPLPSDVIPAVLGNVPTPRVGDTLTVFGYGVAIRGDGKSGGTLRAAQLAVTGKPGNLQIRLIDPKTEVKCPASAHAPAIPARRSLPAPTSSAWCVGRPAPT